MICDFQNKNKQEEFKAKEPPKNNQNFFALKSTKALTIPKDVNLHTDDREREKSKQRDGKT